MATFDFLNFGRGQISNASPLLVPNNAFLEMINVNHVYNEGVLLKRPGYETIGSALESGKAIQGLFNFKQSSTVQKMLATCNDSGDNDTQLFFSTGGAWTEVGAAETAWANVAGADVEMASFLGYCFFVGYSATDGFLPVASLTGTTFSTSDQVTDMPKAKYIVKYRDRLYLLNCNNSVDQPFRVYKSSILTSSGSITWTPGSDFFDVGYSEEISGGGIIGGKLAIFTEVSFYLFDGINDILSDPIFIGCSNHRTIRNFGAFTYWANEDGVWRSSGGIPENISEPVQDFIHAQDMTGSRAEIINGEYYLWLGNVTVNGIIYTNITLILNIQSLTWRMYKTDKFFNVFAKFYQSGEHFLYMGGASDGTVSRLGKYTDSTLLKADDTKDIPSSFLTGYLHFDDPKTKKLISNIITYAEKPQSLKLKARVVSKKDKVTTKFEPLIEVINMINEKSDFNKEGHFLQIKGEEFSSNEFWSFYGFTVDVESRTKYKK
jgi:hypothetical protein